MVKKKKTLYKAHRKKPAIYRYFLHFCPYSPGVIIWRPIKIRQAKPDDVLRNNEILARGIKDVLRDPYRCGEIESLYEMYRDIVRSRQKNTRKYLPNNPELIVELPSLKDSDNDCRKALRNFAESLEKVADGRHKEEKAKGAGGERKPTKTVNPYTEIDLAERTLIIGEDKHLITSEPAWGFLKTLVDNKRQNKVTPQKDGLVNWKSAIDMLRRQIGKEAYHQIVKASKGLYWLEPSVKISGGSQVGIKLTKLAKEKPL
ncbi:MAG: hypothetical protein HQ580_14670 [Planctomycetes bacterium]|nr:hypothetical protein [Planctomycetota bacterium]